MRILKINITFIFGAKEGENERSEPGHLKSGGEVKEKKKMGKEKIS